MSVPINCPLCSMGSAAQQVITPHVYGDMDHKHSFFQCTSCDVIYLYPQLNPEQEAKFYAKEFEGFMASRSGEQAGWEGPEKHIKANKEQFERRWKYLEKFLPPQGKILEFGCSSGFMLYPLQDKGYECAGIEPSGIFSKYVQSRGVHIFNDSKSVEGLFDVVMHFFVLEHVRNPLEFLQENLKLLKPGGKLIVEIPNAADPLYTIYDIPAFERFYWSIAHHWYFTEKSMGYLLKKLPGTSYSLIRDQRYDLSNHMTWARDGKPGGMGRLSSKLGLDLEKHYKKALVESGHCDTLIAIIEKEG